MIEITKKLKLAPAARKAYGVQAKGRLALTFEIRRKSRARIQLGSGEEIALMLPRDEVLRGGDLVVASNGQVIEVVAAPEPVLNITCEDADDLMRVAYHLGSRHVPVEVGEGCLRILAGQEPQAMLEQLGARVSALQAPFEPDMPAAESHEAHGHASGAHDAAAHVHGPGCGHDHGGDGGHAHDHDHDHDHEHEHGHGHGHGHAHAAPPRQGRPVGIPVKAAPVQAHAHAHAHHGHDDGESHAGRILHYSEEGGTGHVHGPDCGHDHHEGHGHDHDHGHDHGHKGHSH